MKKFIFKTEVTGRDNFLRAKDLPDAKMLLKKAGIKFVVLYETQYHNAKKPLNQFNFEMSLR